MARLLYDAKARRASDQRVAVRDHNRCEQRFRVTASQKLVALVPSIRIGLEAEPQRSCQPKLIISIGQKSKVSALAADKQVK